MSTNYDEDDQDLDEEDRETMEFAIDGLLDLDAFSAEDVTELVPDYLAACRERNILKVRIVHREGTDMMQQKVQAILDRLPEVHAHRPADPGSRGATIVELLPRDEPER